jgi:AraC-like DNA-binding protein
MLLSSPKYGIIALAPVTLDNISGLLLSGSETFSTETDFGTILIQEFNTEHYSIRYIIFNFLKKITLLFNQDRTGIRSRFILEGSLNIKTSSREKVQLKEGQFVLLSGLDTNETVIFDKGKEYRLFDTAYSVDLLKKLVASFPSLNEFISTDGTPKSFFKINKPRFASPKMTEIVYDLLKSPYDKNLQKLYFENKMNDFLFEVLAQTYKTEPGPVDLTQKEKDAVFNARSIILKDLRQHYTIQEISQQVCLNEFKLKAGFKQQFDTGIFECLVQARMQKARKLLLETDKPIKEIASLTGYDYLTSFITAFRKYFDYTPGSLRRK